MISLSRQHRTNTSNSTTRLEWENLLEANAYRPAKKRKDFFCNCFLRNLQEEEEERSVPHSPHTSFLVQSFFLFLSYIPCLSSTTTTATFEKYSSNLTTLEPSCSHHAGGEPSRETRLITNKRLAKHLQKTRAEVRMVQTFAPKRPLCHSMYHIEQLYLPVDTIFLSLSDYSMISLLISPFAFLLLLFLLSLLRFLCFNFYFCFYFYFNSCHP